MTYEETATPRQVGVRNDGGREKGLGRTREVTAPVRTARGTRYNS